MKRIITVKLNKNSTRLEIAEKATFDDVEKELKEKVKELKKFYKEEKVPIYVTGKILNKQEMETIKKIIKKAIDVEVTVDSPEELGLHGIRRAYNKEINISETQYYRTSLRSGQKIENEASVVIIGDVNSGAEVISAGNIVVQGTLRGLAHAGAKGNKKAFISALNIDVPQIRIANVIREIERDEEDYRQKMYAYVNEDGKIVLE